MRPEDDIFDHRPSPKSLFKGALILIAALVAATALNKLVYRPIAKWVVTPSETRAPWVEALATYKTGFDGISEIQPLDRASPVFREMHMEAILDANEQKRRLWTTYKSGQGRYGVLRRYSTVEGAFIYTWLLAEDGRLRYIHDRTRDGGAAATAVDTYTPISARMGFMRDEKFIEGEPAAEDSPILVIQLDIGRYSPARVY